MIVFKLVAFVFRFRTARRCGDGKLQNEATVNGAVWMPLQLARTGTR